MVDHVQEVRTEHLLRHSERPLRIQDKSLVFCLWTGEVCSGDAGLKRREAEPRSQKRGLLKRGRIS